MKLEMETLKSKSKRKSIKKLKSNTTVILAHLASPEMHLSF